DNITSAELTELKQALLASLAALSPVIAHEITKQADGSLKPTETDVAGSKLIMLTATIYNAINALEAGTPAQSMPTLSHQEDTVTPSDVTPIMSEKIQEVSGNVQKLERKLTILRSKSTTPRQTELLDLIMLNLNSLSEECKLWLSSVKMATASEEELRVVLDVVNRMATKAPRFDNQSASMSVNAEKSLNLARLADLVERLNSRSPKYDEQRVDPKKSKIAALDTLISQISKATERKMADQAVELTPSQKRDMEFVKLGRMVEKQPKRFDDQVWESKQDRFINEITLMLRKLEELREHESKLESQRYMMSETQERNMFLAKVGGQISRMEKRFSSQDASFVKRERRNSDIEQMLEKMSPRMDDQSAEFSPSGSNPIVRRKTLQSAPDMPRQVQSHTVFPAHPEVEDDVAAMTPEQPKRRSLLSRLPSLRKSTIAT
ncbi:hypothetical protein EDD86DRAFT_202105, partial [Gorgonomyces haynaldii]